MKELEVRVYKDGRRGASIADRDCAGWYYLDTNKPVLDCGKGLSWSYSENWTVFVTGDVLVGIDVAKVEELPYELGDYKFVLSTDENRRVSSSEDFITIWTRKESFLKMVGTGLNDQLNLYSTYDMEKDGDVYFNTVRIDDRIITVCTREDVSLKMVEY